MAELEQYQSEAEAVDVSKVQGSFVTLRQKMHEMNIPVSDRRWKAALKLIKANAYLEGRTAAIDDDLEVLAPALWQEPGQITQIKAQIMGFANPLNQKALELQDEALEIWQNVMTAPEDKVTALGNEANTKLKKSKTELETLQSQAESTGKDSSRIKDVYAQLDEWHKEVINKAFGI